MTALTDLTWPRFTERLELRPARAEDAAAIWQWHRLPEVSEWLTRATGDLQEFTTRAKTHLAESVTVSLDGRIVGTAKVHVEDGWAQAEIAEQARGTQCELGWVLDPAVHGQGLGTELGRELLSVAFGLGVRRVVAMCFADNTASWRLMARLGMRLEGHYRAESLHRTGRWLDGMTWAMLAEEWQQA